MIIAGYESSTLSGSTPITLITTLTHIYLGDEKIATFQSQTDDTPKTPDDDKLIYHISDHLNSSSLDLSSTGLVLQATDYQPFGKTITYEVTNKRVKGKKGGYTNKYQFANKQIDLESDLQYFEKRYYDNRIGRFTTEDPVYWEVGKTKRPNNYFTDPEQWNSYSYVRNNPINMVDPTGECAFGDPNTSCLSVVATYATYIPEAIIGLEIASAPGDQTLAQDTANVQKQQDNINGGGIVALGVGGLSAAKSAGTALVKGITKIVNTVVKTTQKSFSLDSKIVGQMNERGWTEKSINDAIKKPVKTGQTVDNTKGKTSPSGDPATAYFTSNNQYVVRNDVTGNIVQISNTTVPNWTVDVRITFAPPKKSK